MDGKTIPDKRVEELVRQNLIGGLSDLVNNSEDHSPYELTNAVNSVLFRDSEKYIPITDQMRGYTKRNSAHLPS